jgi:hypothetical protein
VRDAFYPSSSYPLFFFFSPPPTVSSSASPRLLPSLLLLVPSSCYALLAPFYDTILPSSSHSHLTSLRTYIREPMDLGTITQEARMCFFGTDHALFAKVRYCISTIPMGSMAALYHCLNLLFLESQIVLYYFLFFSIIKMLSLLCILFYPS